MIQEILQVENVSHLQVIGEVSDTQLSLGWRTLDEKKKETDICLGCGTFQLNDKVKRIGWEVSWIGFSKRLLLFDMLHKKF